jgi:hypothetical protein
MEDDMRKKFDKVGKNTFKAVKSFSLPRDTASSALEGRLKAAVNSKRKAKKKILKSAVIKKVKF